MFYVLQHRKDKDMFFTYYKYKIEDTDNPDDLEDLGLEIICNTEKLTLVQAYELIDLIEDKLETITH